VERNAASVAVTGLGVVTAAGQTVETFWATLKGGRSTAKPITAFDASALDVQFACLVDDFDVHRVLRPRDARRMDRFSQFAVVAALDAFSDSGIAQYDPSRAAVIVGTGVGGQATNEAQYSNFLSGGSARVNPMTIPMTMPNAASAVIAIELGIHGPTMTVCTACSSGAHAIGEAFELIRHGRVDMAIAGGVESAVTPSTLSAFANLGALSRRNDDPAAASRPFDSQRDGFVLGEGAAFCVLERSDRAVARNARSYATLSAYACNSDAYHLVTPSPDGAGAEACMLAAMREAGVAASEVVHISAHGTSTALNDALEARAIRSIWGERTPAITAVKGAIGHLLGGAGAVGFLEGCLAVHAGEVPPVANFESQGSEETIDIVAEHPRTVSPGAVLVNSFAFGGHNASLILQPA
jgi:3-oxoacyl-[acyl-carrier-protein] synthase II